MNYIAVPNILFHYVKEGKRIVRDYPISPAALRVYVYLLGCSFHNNAINVKYRTITSRCRFGDHKTAVDAIAELTAHGLVTRHCRAGKGGRKISNGYTIRKLPGHYFKLDKTAVQAYIDSYAFSVYLCLCMHSNRHHRAYPSVAKLSYETGLTKVSARRKIVYLTQRLFIRKIASKSDYGDMNNNEYRITPLVERNAAYHKLRKIHKKPGRFLNSVERIQLVSVQVAGCQFFIVRTGGLYFTHRFLYPPEYDSTKRKSSYSL